MRAKSKAEDKPAQPKKPTPPPQADIVVRLPEGRAREVLFTALFQSGAVYETPQYQETYAKMRALLRKSGVYSIRPDKIRSPRTDPLHMLAQSAFRVQSRLQSPLFSADLPAFHQELELLVQKAQDAVQKLKGFPPAKVELTEPEEAKLRTLLEKLIALAHEKENIKFISNYLFAIYRILAPGTLAEAFKKRSAVAQREILKEQRKLLQRMGLSKPKK